MKNARGAVAVLLLILVTIFAIQNREPMDVSILTWSISMPKVFLILGTYVLGMISGWGLVALVRRSF